MEMYRVVHYGPAVGVGVSRSVYLGISAIGKMNTPDNPYIVPNEIIAAEIGRYLRLPIPPFCAISGGANSDTHFASLDFNLTGASLPPIIPPRFYNEFREHVGALLAFDIYIANSDRHNGNLSADYAGKQFNVFDHSHVLLSGTAPQGKERLLRAEASLVVDGSLGGNKHCLLDQIDDDALFIMGLDRIESIPDWVLEDIVSSSSSHGLTQDLSEALIGFLKKRRTEVRGLISGNKTAFTQLKAWSVL